MDNITTKAYASYMEQTLQEMVTLPIEGICIITKLSGGAVFTSYYNSTSMDKITYAGLIQQDAMIETLRINKMLHGAEADPDADNI